MLLRPPVIITPRLLPGVKIGDHFLSFRLEEIEKNGKACYHFYLDGPTELLKTQATFKCPQSYTMQMVLEDLLGFFTYYGDPCYKDEENIETDLVRWCKEHHSELEEVESIVLDTPNLIEE